MTMLFFPRSPADDGSLAAEVMSGGPAARLFPSVAESMERMPTSPRLGADSFATTSDAAREKMDAILAGGGALVSTGQQPGLFLGPLYTVYKATSAIRLAARLERETGRPCMAVFWVAADDHDWEEVGLTRVLDSDESLVDIRLTPPPGWKHRSVGEAIPADSIDAPLERLLTALPAGAESDFGYALRQAYGQSSTMAQAFTRSMQHLFADHDLALLDSSRPDVRSAAAAFHAAIIDNPNLVTEAMEAGRSAVEATGHAPTLNPPDAGLQLFLEWDDRRQHLLLLEGDFSVPRGPTWTRGELLSHLHRSSGSFTPAAALRPVLESWLLPITRTVLGPGEMSYWAQLRPLFEALGVAMPAVTLREGWLVVEPRVQRLLEKLEVDPFAVVDDSAKIRRRILDVGRPAAVADAVSALQIGTGEQLRRLEEGGRLELPGLSGAVGKARHGIEGALDDLLGVVDRRVAERASISLAQLDRLESHLRPGGGVQERVLGAVHYALRFGRGMVGDLMASGRVAGVPDPD